MGQSQVEAIDNRYLHSRQIINAIVLVENNTCCIPHQIVTVFRIATTRFLRP